MLTIRSPTSHSVSSSVTTQDASSIAMLEDEEGYDDDDDGYVGMWILIQNLLGFSDVIRHNLAQWRKVICAFSFWLLRIRALVSF